jgi:hypothetical protein
VPRGLSIGRDKIERDGPPRQQILDAAKRGDRAAALFERAEPAAHGFKIEPVADPDPGAPRGRSGFIGERFGHVGDQSVAVGKKPYGGEGLRNSQKVGEDHHEARQSERNEQRSTSGHWRHPQAPADVENRNDTHCQARVTIPQLRNLARGKVR